MKRVLVSAAAFLLSSMMFAISYKDNTYQKLANEYSKKSQQALDAGEYDLSIEYAQKAEENAALSQAFIKSMAAKGYADSIMKRAKQKLDYAKKNDAEKNFPMAYSVAEKAYANALEAYNKEDYESAEKYAQQVLDALADVRSVNALPKYYVVRPWADSKDCYWNIAGRSYVYNNPRLWENLYQANKSKMPDPSNPNIILPGMKMEIPSITGEYREGVYDPSIKYDGYSANR